MMALLTALIAAIEILWLGQPGAPMAWKIAKGERTCQK
jgi:hypothetical protein